MKKTRIQKGITLIALIITIVVLLIIATVTIGAVQDSKIITHAEKSAKDYNQAKVNELSILEQYEVMLDEKQGIGPWEIQSDGEIVINKKTGETKKIGDTFTNDEVLEKTGGTKSSYEDTWTILSVENGRLKLVSTSNVKENVKLGMSDSNAYIKDENGEDKLRNEIVEIYNRGEDKNLNLEIAIWSYKNIENTLNDITQTTTGIPSARSIKIEDLEAKEVLNITEEKKLELSSNEYAKLYNYFYIEDKLGVFWKTKALGENQWSDISKTRGVAPFIVVDKNKNTVVIDEDKEEVVLEHNYYEPYNFTDEQKTKYNNLLSGFPYLLASPYVKCSTGLADFGIRFVITGSSISYNGLFDSGGIVFSGASGGVRAIVYV